MDWWPRFDPAEVAADFARIAAAGMDSVRCFLRWEDFQPEPDRVDRAMLGHLVAVADAAAQRRAAADADPVHRPHERRELDPGLGAGRQRARPTVPRRSGGRVADGGLRNWFTDAGLMRAQALLAAEAAAALAGHDALWAWDLGNENSNCSVPPDREHGRRWLGEMTAAIRGADPDAVITIGLHMEDLEEDRHLGPREAAEACDFLTMHGYPIYARWSEGPLDQELVPFLARITRWLGEGKDVLFSEFGLPTFRPGAGADDTARPRARALVEEEAAASYTGRVLDGLREAGSLGGDALVLSPTTRPRCGPSRRWTRRGTSGRSGSGAPTARRSRRCRS